MVPKKKLYAENKNLKARLVALNAEPRANLKARLKASDEKVKVLTEEVAALKKEVQELVKDVTAAAADA